MTSTFIVPLNNPEGALDGFFRSVAAVKSKQDRRIGFILSVAGTESSDISGISAAGADAEQRRATPAADAEALILGHPVAGELPISPAGIVSPVVLTRAALQYFRPEITIADCGSFKAPAVQHFAAGCVPARCVSTGQAMDYSQAEKLFFTGMQFGKALAAQNDMLLLAECVPAGTTSAFALLKIFGYPCDGLVPSSLPEGSNGVREAAVAAGLQKAGLTAAMARSVPLHAVSAVGDPMQPFAAGVALAASSNVPVMLCGGSQMLAVRTLAQKAAAAFQLDWKAHNVAVVTTRWVASAKSSNCAALAAMLDCPMAASGLDLSMSRHAGLRAYEEGNVKEGVGAGGAMATAHFMTGADVRQLVAAVDAEYDLMAPAAVPACRSLAAVQPG